METSKFSKTSSCLVHQTVFQTSSHFLVLIARKFSELVLLKVDPTRSGKML